MMRVKPIFAGRNQRKNSCLTGFRGWQPLPEPTTRGPACDPYQCFDLTSSVPCISVRKFGFAARVSRFEPTHSTSYRPICWCDMVARKDTSSPPKACLYLGVMVHIEGFSDAWWHVNRCVRSLLSLIWLPFNCFPFWFWY